MISEKKWLAPAVLEQLAGKTGVQGGTKTDGGDGRWGRVGKREVGERLWLTLCQPVTVWLAATHLRTSDLQARSLTVKL